MKILYLYAELGPYNIALFKHLTQQCGVIMHAVHWDHRRLTPFTPPPLENVSYYRRSQYAGRELVTLVRSIDPQLIYVSGWMDRAYLPIAREFKARGVPVLVGFDDQWFGTLRQRVGAVVFRFYLAGCFSHAWVTGPRQYEYARRMGFPHARILSDFQACDYPLFSKAGVTLEMKRNNYPKAFLFVGRFTHVKGIDVLVKAFRIYRDSLRGTWNLTCVGNGTMRSLLDAEPRIEVCDFADQRMLMELCGRAGAFVLPSRHEPWGVVVHEFAAAGLPLLLSNAVGAQASFLIDGFNGYSFPGNSPHALAEAMLRLSRESDLVLCQMGQNSRRLASRVDLETSAASLMSVLPWTAERSSSK